MNKSYQIIRFLPKGKPYHAPHSQTYYEEFYGFYQKYNLPGTMEDIIKEQEAEYDHYTKVDIPMGASRIGGPICDIPNNMAWPKGYCFMGQLDLQVFSRYDRMHILPKTGYLYFFVKPKGEAGLVVYKDVTVEDLWREIMVHEEWYYSGRLIGEMREEDENWSSRFVLDDEYDDDEECGDDGDDEEYGDDEGELVWDEFQGSDMSKIFGIGTNVQDGEEEIVEKMQGNVLLLQVGSDFLGEGVHCVYIHENDLAELDFSKCVFDYSQT